MFLSEKIKKRRLIIVLNVDFVYFQHIEPVSQSLSHAKRRHHRFFQNEAVNISSMVKSSKRPMSMSKVLSHLAAAGRALQVKDGPKVPRAGPILPTQPTPFSSAPTPPASFGDQGAGWKGSCYQAPRHQNHSPDG